MISNDTGPLHLAAAAVRVSWGSTPARAPLAALLDRESRPFRVVSGSPSFIKNCRRLECMAEFIKPRVADRRLSSNR